MEQLRFPDSQGQGSHHTANVRTSTGSSKPVTWIDHPAFLEFFSGSGLVAQGLKNIFSPIWANDNCIKKGSVYKANHGADYFRLESIAQINGKELPEAQLAWASFPCQDLSLAGLTEGINGSRSGLVWEWLRVIDEMPVRPRLLVAENVVGLVSAAGGSHYRALHEAFVNRGYIVGAMVLDAALWTPQSRPRVFVVAIDSNSLVPAGLTSFYPNWLHPESLRKAAKGLKNWVWWSMPQPPTRKKQLSDIVEWDAPFADPETEKRNISLIAPRHYALINALPKNKSFVAPGYKRTRSGKQVLELRFDQIAGCLRTPEGGSSRQVLVFRSNGKLRSRLLTVRETARLMGAPETYKIPGSYNDGYKAMGDAVAAPVARWLGKKLLLPLVLAAYEQETTKKAR